MENVHSTTGQTRVPQNGDEYGVFTFDIALQAVVKGQRIKRRGWNGEGQFVEMQVPDENSKMRKPYLYISPVDGELVPWIASQTDLLADDWVIIENLAD